METIYTLSDDRQQQALSKIVAMIRMSASSRKSISFKAVALLALNDDDIITMFDNAGGPGLPDGFGGNSLALAEYCRSITID